MCTRPCVPPFALNVHLPLHCPQCALVGLLNKACFECQTPQPDTLQGTTVATDSTGHSFSFYLLLCVREKVFRGNGDNDSGEAVLFWFLISKLSMSN